MLLLPRKRIKRLQLPSNTFRQPKKSPIVLIKNDIQATAILPTPLLHTTSSNMFITRARRNVCYLLPVIRRLYRPVCGVTLHNATQNLALCQSSTMVHTVQSRSLPEIARQLNNCDNTQDVFSLLYLSSTNSDASNSLKSLEKLCILVTLRRHTDLLSKTLLVQLLETSLHNIDSLPIGSLLSLLQSTLMLFGINSEFTPRIISELQRRIQQDEMGIVGFCEIAERFFLSRERLAIVEEMRNPSHNSNGQTDQRVTAVVKYHWRQVKLMLIFFDDIFGSVRDHSYREQLAIWRLNTLTEKYNYPAWKCGPSYGSARKYSYSTPIHKVSPYVKLSERYVSELLKFNVHISNMSYNSLIDAILFHNAEFFSRKLLLESALCMKRRRFSVPNILDILADDFTNNSSSYSDEEMADLVSCVGFFRYFPTRHWNFLLVIEQELERRRDFMAVSTTLKILAHCGFLGVLSATHHDYIPSFPAFSENAKAKTEDFRNLLAAVTATNYVPLKMVLPFINELMGSTKSFSHMELRKTPTRVKRRVMAQLNELLGSEYYYTIEPRDQDVISPDFIIFVRNRKALTRASIKKDAETNFDDIISLVQHPAETASDAVAPRSVLTNPNPLSFCWKTESGRADDEEFDVDGDEPTDEEELWSTTPMPGLTPPEPVNQMLNYFWAERDVVYKLPLLVVAYSELNFRNQEPLGPLSLAERFIVADHERVLLVTEQSLKKQLKRFIDFDTSTKR